MKALLTIEGLEGHSVEVYSPGFLQGPRLTIDAGPAPKGKGRNVYTLQGGNGQPITIRLKPSLVYDLPSVEVNGTRRELVPPLKWYQYLLSLFPLVLILGGIPGIIFALILFLVNIRVWRSGLPAVAKYVLVLALSLGLPLLYYIVLFLLAFYVQAG